MRMTLDRDGTAPGRSLRLVVVLPGNLLHALRHEPSAAEDRDLRAIGSSQDQHFGVQVCMVSGRKVQVWLSFSATFFHGLRIATRRRSDLPRVGQLFLGHLS
jgi:hypothetical protein